MIQHQKHLVTTPTILLPVPISHSRAPTIPVSISVRSQKALPKKHCWTLLDEDLAQELHLHLQTKGKYVRAQDLVDYLDVPEVKLRFKLKRAITERTAQRWMHKMGYRWTKTPSGQYVDGYEQKDVIEFRHTVFFPAWYRQESRMWSWSKEGADEESAWPHDIEDGLRHFENQRHTATWFQDESTFYANDRHQMR